MTRRRLKQRFPLAYLNSSSMVSLAAGIGAGSTIGHLVSIGPGVQIGRHTSVNRGTIVASGHIGNFTSIAQFVHIGGHKHPLDHLSTSPRLYGEENLIGVSRPFDEFPEPPVIGSDVWIGAGAVVAQGVNIGHGAVVGAGAVVTRDVEPFAVVAGVPASTIRARFPEETIHRLMQMAWWEWPDSRLTRLRAAMDAGSDFHQELLKLSDLAD